MVQETTLTLTEYAAMRGVSRRLVAEKWPKRHADVWPSPVGTRAPHGHGRPASVYRLADLDRVWAADQPEGVTLAEYAQSRGLARTTVTNTWPGRYADIWPEPVGRRGNAYVYRPGDLDQVRRRAAGLPPAEGAPDDLLSWEGVCAYLGRGGVALKTMQWRRWAGKWESGVVGSDGVERWSRGRVEELQEGLARRGE